MLTANDPRARGVQTALVPLATTLVLRLDAQVTQPPPRLLEQRVKRTLEQDVKSLDTGAFPWLVARGIPVPPLPRRS